MAVIPGDRAQQIVFCKQHLAPWAANAAAIGIVAGDVTTLTTRTDAAQTALNAALAARQTAKAATEAYYNAVDLMTDKAREIVKTIKAYADSKNDPNIFILAQIPAPTPPVAGSSVPPGKPDRFNVTLNPGGSLTLAWRSTNAASSTGGSFIIARRPAPTASDPNPPYAVVGTAAGSGQSEAGGSRTITFTDLSIPFGTTSVSYIVTPRRGGKNGESSDAYTVTFGGAGLNLTTSAAPAPTGFTLAA